jgi:hypothetical protein
MCRPLAAVNAAACSTSACHLTFVRPDGDDDDDWLSVSKRGSRRPTVRAAVIIAHTLLLLLPLNLAAVDLQVAEWPIEIDGYLNEWGGVLPTGLEPGGENIGLRGAFAGTDDHEADAYALWDAEFLYLAVAVTDDAVDIARISPDNQVWTGPDGTRKDRMFYYDHLRVFIRDPSSNLGYNIWITPKQADGAPYAWGHRQRSPADEQLPVLLAGELVGGIYTFEVALPWSWLEIAPRTGTVIKARILLVDSDLPDVPIEDKIAGEAEKWIWWSGAFQLTGDLPRDEEAEAAAAAALAQERRRQEAVLAEEQMRRAVAARAQAEADSLAAVKKAARDSAAAQSAQAWEARQREKRARAASALTARPVGPPEWLVAIPRAPELRDEQVHEYLRFLRRDGLRLIRKRISSRADYVIRDMADDAGSQRVLARAFMTNMLAAIENDLSVAGGWAQPPVLSAAQRSGMTPESGVTLVREIVAHVRKALEKGKAPTTGEAIERAAKKAGMTPDQAHVLLDSLLSIE